MYTVHSAERFNIIFVSATIASAMVWLASVFVQLAWVSPRGSMLGVEAGRIYIVRQDVSNYPKKYVGWSFGTSSMPLNWRFQSGFAGSFAVSIPLWQTTILFTIGALLALPAIHACRGRAASVSACQQCGYPRSGISRSTVCPECGNRWIAGG